MPNVRNVVGKFPKKSLLSLVLVLAFIVSVFVGASVFNALTKEVVVTQDGKKVVFKTLADTVGDLLQQKAIYVSKSDAMNVPLNAKLQMTKNNQIHIVKAVPIVVKVDGKQIPILTASATIEDFLKEGKLDLSSMDRVEGVSLNQKIISGLKFSVVRVTETMVTEQETIPYTTKRVSNPEMARGEEKTTSKGADGLLQKTMRVVWEDGKEVARKIVSQNVLQIPTTRIVEFGTLLQHTTSRGDTLRYKNAKRMVATAYTASYQDTGKSPGHPGFGITATGVRAKRGTIAVDPRVIPLGTRVYIEVAGNTPDYGFAIAADTGGAIKGNKIDVYLDDLYSVNQWGKRNVKVYILE